MWFKVRVRVRCDATVTMTTVATTVDNCCKSITKVVVAATNGFVGCRLLVVVGGLIMLSYFRADISNVQTNTRL